MGIQATDWVNWVLRSIFSFLDGIVFSLIKWVMYGVFDLSRITANTEIFSGIYSRIYVILGIFMAFKLSFSFFQYIIDPDSMTGKSEKGVTKLLTRVIVMLGALILLPGLLFGVGGEEGLIYTAQRSFLPVLPRLIFGSSGGNFEGTVEESAENVTVAIMNSFVSVPENIDEYCIKGTYASHKPIEKSEDFTAVLKQECAGMRGKYYVYSYNYFFSTVTGVLVIALFLGITLGIAKRIFKLMILELIAPVPIMSLIDPKGSKDGAFSKWLGNLISTFVDLFVKLGLVYLIIVIIQQITTQDMFENMPNENGFFRGTYLKLFLILGLIFFAKEAPKFIKDSLGVKDSGGSLFDDVKSVGKAAGLVGAGSLATVSGAISSGKASYMADEANGKNHALNLVKNLGVGALGGITGGLTSAHAAFNAKDHSFKAGMDNINKRNELAYARGVAGSTFMGRASSDIRRALTGETKADIMARSIAANEALGSAGESLYSYLEDRAVKAGANEAITGTRADGKTKFNTTYNEFTSEMLRAKQRGDATFTVAGQTFETYGQEAGKIEGDLKTAAADAWGTKELEKKEEERDKTFEAFRQSYVNNGGKAAFTTDSNGKTIINSNALKGEFKTASRDAKIAKISPKYGKYKANAGKK